MLVYVGSSISIYFPPICVMLGGLLILQSLVIRSDQLDQSDTLASSGQLVQSDKPLGEVPLVEFQSVLHGMRPFNWPRRWHRRR